MTDSMMAAQKWWEERIATGRTYAVADQIASLAAVIRSAVEAERTALLGKAIDLVADLVAERARGKALAEALRDQWVSNHAEHCTDLADGKCPGKRRCHWPVPEVLAAYESKVPDA